MTKRLSSKINVLTSAPLIIALAVLISVPTNALGDEICYDLLAGAGTDGQNTVAGSVCAEVVDGNLIVSYTTFSPWELEAYHLWVGDPTDIDGNGSPDAMPQNKFGSPKLGRFPYSEINLSGGEPIYGKTITITPAELDLAELCDAEPGLTAVAHAVVASDTDGDGVLDSFPTGFGDGFDLGGNSWALGIEVPLCTVYSFDSAGLEETISEFVGDDGVVGVQVTHQGGNPSQPYFLGQLDFDQDGTSDLTGLPFYCIDLANTIGGGWYTALMLSSYDTRVADLPGIVNEFNLDKANYILNNFSIGDDLGNGATVTGGDIQRTLWSLVFGELPGAGAFASGPSNDANVADMLDAANASGNGYEPPCDGKVAVILYPINGDNIAAQALIAQALVTDFPAACNASCNTVCEE